jgi:tetratricopeptide (TPR) repeat protein
MLQHYNNDSVQLGRTLIQLAELRKLQLEYDESLANYERALDIFLQQTFVFDFYLIISDIINDMGKIYIEEKNCDYLSAIKYDLIKYRYILKHVLYVRSGQKRVRCVNQWDLGQCQVELAYKYLAIGEREAAMIRLSEALVSYCEFDFVDIKDYKAIRHSQLQEKLADVSVQSHRYKEAYEYIKMSMTYYQEQVYMLEANVRLGADDTITCMKYCREWEKLEARRQVLENKMINIKKLKENSNMEEKDF